MIASISSRRWLGGLALLLAVLWPSGAFAQDEAFKRGLDARDKKNWKQAETEMRAAIASESKEASRKVGGGFLRGGTEYVPHYLLGEALYNLNDCAGAVTEWEISQLQGVIGSAAREFSTFMQNGIRACAMKGVLPPAEFKTQSAQANQDVRDAMAFADRISKTGNGDAWRPELREQYSRIGPDLNTAQVRLGAGMKTRQASDFNEARAAAGRVVIALKSFETALNTSIENVSSVRGRSREVDQEIAKAENNDRAIDALKTPLSQALATTRQTGRDALGRAREQKAVAERTQNVSAANDALKYAEDASTILEQVLGEATKIARAALDHELADAGAAAAEALSFLDSSLTTLGTLFQDKPAMVTPEVQSQRDALDKRVTSIRRRIEAAQKSQSVGGLKDAARLAGEARTDLEKLVTSFGPLSLRNRGVQASLEDGARQFFAGEYQQALATLDPNALADAPLQLHLHLFRAAALYHLFVRSGEKNEALKTQALVEVDACKRLNSQFTPDSRAFAPRFLTFYQNGAATTP
jgi:phosphopantetheine adenylyltransferase